MRKIYQSSQFDDKNVFRGEKIQISAVRTGACEYMDATLLADFFREPPHLRATRELLTNFRTQSTRRVLISLLQYVKHI